ncbi:MAG: OsmC family protein [Rhodothermales bacterium]
MSDQKLNGVPVADCLGLVNHVKDNPDAGQTVWAAVTTWKGGFQCHNVIRDHAVEMDEPEQLGGTNTAPNMVEQVLAAYGSCLTVGYSLNASVRGITVNEIRVEVEGDLDLAGFFGLSDETPAGFSRIRTRVHLDADASDEELQELHDHVLKTSPVGSILTRPLDVQTELVGAKGTVTAG